jgi:hypothetical protein
MTTATKAGPIRRDEAYPLSVFRRLAGIGDFTWRRLKKELPVVRLGGKTWVRGSDWLDFLEKHQSKQLGN